MTDFVPIAGGVALILFGVRFLRKGLDRLLGGRMEWWLQRVAGNPLRALATGLGLAVVVPSSTSISVLSVQMVQSGRVKFRQMLVVLLGANVGLTLLVWLGALPLEQLGLGMVAGGVLLFQFTHARRSRGVGQVVLGLGVVLMGIVAIKAATAGLAAGGDMARAIMLVSHHVWLLTAMAAILTLLVQSSTATILMIVGLGAVEHLSLTFAVAVVAGANIGIALTALALGWSHVESRRLALGNLMVRTAAALLMVAISTPIAGALAATPGTYELRVGYAHTGLNIVAAMLGLALLRPLVAWVESLVPQPSGAATTFGPRYVNPDVIDDNARFALGQSQREILRVSEIARAMLEDLWRALDENDAQLAKEVARRDDRIDQLDETIKQYIARLCGDGIEGADPAAPMRQLRYLAELETIGDVIDKNLSELVIKKVRGSLRFSKAGRDELQSFYEQVHENMRLAETAFQGGDVSLAKQLIQQKRQLSARQRDYRDRHLTRLSAGVTQSHETSSVHLDILTCLKRINTCATHAAYAVLDKPKWPDERAEGDGATATTDTQASTAAASAAHPKPIS